MLPRPVDGMAGHPAGDGAVPRSQALGRHRTVRQGLALGYQVPAARCRLPGRRPRPGGAGDGLTALVRRNMLVSPPGGLRWFQRGEGQGCEHR
ncbi:hypothetical protein RHRU231_430084 [Rhodococcus ruber]|uniref:Uncharacterized protein n=1 Tax=Rhodococcus ruber TaxID=1830 RepID=A0A098BLV7_9NOCA|nr:hypothetical protein RHRU231_430084 [Rhodococcus ruber]